MNDSRVLAARLHGRRLPSGGGVEALLVHEREPGLWEALLRPGKRIAEGQELSFSDGTRTIFGSMNGWLEDGLCLLAFDPGSHPEQLGGVPLPPYIHAELGDPERYQTVYARDPGSAAAPTAGLHFTPSLLQQLRDDGIETAFLTLHVGPATFRPVHVENAREHRMHAEFFRVPQMAAEKLTRARHEHRRIIAVGTTSVRVLEQIGANGDTQRIGACDGWTRLLILPGHRYHLVDGLITNFHLPRSTLLMLVAALSGRELMFRAYAEAIRLGYRFYSFGDAMLIL
jgi:S-adenosylmethionine:tRNA ribosyltransferase-isomerase